MSQRQLWSYFEVNMFCLLFVSSIFLSLFLFFSLFVRFLPLLHLREQLQYGWNIVLHLLSVCVCPRSGKLRTQKLKSHLMRTQSLKVLPLKPGIGQYIAMHATLTARDFFLAIFYLSGPFTCILS